MWASREAAERWRAQEASRARLFGPATAVMLDESDIEEGDRVLDIGAGTGDQTLMAARRVGPRGSVLATDSAASMLEIAAEAARNAGFTNVTTRVLDAQHLDRELDAEAFDAVISRNGLMFIPDLPRALVGMRRVLVPSGKIAAIVWSAPEHNPIFALPMTIAQQYGALPPSLLRGASPFSLGDPYTLERAFENAKFREVVVKRIPLSYHAPSASAFVQSLLDGGGPLSGAMKGLTEADRTRVRMEIEEEFRRFEGPNSFEAQGESLIGVGTK